MSIENEIRDFVLDNFLFTDDKNAIKNDDSFIERGIIDSTGILEIISFIEEKYSIQVFDEEMIPENLDSVNNIVIFVNKKKAY